MPSDKQYVYDIETPAGKFTVTSDRELPDADILSAAQTFVRDEGESSVMGQVRGDRAVREAKEGKKVHPYALLGAGVGRGVTDMASGIYNLATSLPGAVKDIASNVLSGHGAATVRGFGQGAREGLQGLTDVRAQVGDTDVNEPLLTRAGRVAANVGMMIGGPKGVGAVRQGVRGAAEARAAATAAREAELAALRQTSSTAVPKPPILSATGQPIGTAPLRTTTAAGGQISAPAPPRLPPGYGSTGMGIPGAQPMNVSGFSRPTPTPVPRPAPPAGSRVVSPAEARPAVPPAPTNPIQAIGEALEELRTPPAATAGREGHFKLPKVKDPENRLTAAKRAGIGPEDVPEEVHLRSAERRAARERRQVEGEGPEGVERRLSDRRTAADAPPKARFAPTTEQLTKRVAASKRAPVAGKELDEFIGTRYKDFSGEVPYDRLVKDLRDQFGSERAARMLGITKDEVKQLAPGPSRIPARGRDAIAEADRKQAMGRGGLRQVWVDEGGAVNPKLLLPVAGAGLGAVGGALAGDEGGDAAIGRSLLGGLAGAGAGAFAMNPGAIARGIGRARVEGMLTGAAIPKNLMTAAGSALTSTLEGTGKTRFAPAREMFNPIKNAKEFANAWANPQPHQTGFVMAGRGSKSAFAPSRVIGAIDETAQRALRRAGVSQENIDRMLLTADNDLSALGANTPVGRWFLPFQRTPANAVREGFRELSGLAPGSGKTNMQRALTLGSIPAGAAIGEWSRGNPKQRGLLAAILLAGMGSRTLPATIAASSVAGRQVVGGMSPVPEMAFDLRSGVGWPPAGLKLWQRIMGQK